MARYTTSLAGDDSAPRRARGWVSETIEAAVELPGSASKESFIRDVALCASELVNAALIAGSPVLALALAVDRDRVRLSLLDSGDPAPPRTDALLRAQLIGLRILDRVADGWAIAAHPAGRELWAEIAVPRPVSGDHEDRPLDADQLPGDRLVRPHDGPEDADGPESDRRACNLR